MKLKHLLENEVPNITDLYKAYFYAKYNINNCVPELEPTIMKDPECAYHYALEVIKGRWLEAESNIKTNSCAWEQYLRDFPEARTPNKNIPLVLSNYAILDIPNTIIDE